MLTLHASPYRAHLEELLASVRHELLIASPYVKAREAEWLCKRLARDGATKGLRLRLLTDVRSANVLSGSLDLSALRILSDEVRGCEIINCPRLHAKVYVADEARAVVTSANLTPSGLDSNLEYGVGIADAETVREVRHHMQRYATLGNPLTSEAIGDLERVADNLCAEYQSVENSTQLRLRKRFNETLRRANLHFLRAQIGQRSAHSLFTDAILYLLSLGPMTTRQLHVKVQELMPELCDNTVDLVIDGRAFGKKWKHAVRNAQAHLRRTGRLVRHGDFWAVASAA